MTWINAKERPPTPQDTPFACTISDTLDLTRILHCTILPTWDGSPDALPGEVIQWKPFKDLDITERLAYYIPPEYEDL